MEPFKLITNRDIYEELQVSKQEREKQRHQIKSRWYYIFWGTATVAVCAGQVLVGSGFRRMAESLDRVLDSPIQLDFGIPRLRYPEEGLWHPTNPPMPVDPRYKEDFDRMI